MIKDESKQRISRDIFLRIRIGDTVKLASSEREYIVTGMKTETIGNPQLGRGCVFEYNLFLLPTDSLNSYTRKIGHLDDDAEGLQLVKRGWEG